MEAKHSKSKETRNYHCYLVFLSCYSVMALNVGVFYSFGSLFVDIMTAFNSSRAETAIIQSTAAFFALGSGFFTGSITTKIGFVKSGVLGTVVACASLMLCFFASSLTFLIIFIGVLYGISFSLLYIASSVALGEHFTGRKKMFFMSVQVSGAGIGGMLMPYLLRYLSDSYGLRGAFLLTGALCMNNLPGCFLWRKRISGVRQRQGIEEDKHNFQARFNVHIDVHDHNVNITKKNKQSTNDIPDSVYIGQYPVFQEKTITKTVIIKEAEKGLSFTNLDQKKQTFCMSVKQLLRNKPYTGFVLGMTITLPVSTLIIFFLADIFVGNGLTKEDVSFGFFLYNMAGTIGRLLPGILLQTNYITPLSLPVFCAISAATEVILLSFLKSHWWSIILTSTVGLPSGMLFALFTIGPVKLVDKNLLPVAIGLLFSCSALGQAVTGPITGYIRDVSGSYNIPFYIFASLSLLAAVLFVLAFLAQRKEKKNIRRRSSVFYLTSL